MKTLKRWLIVAICFVAAAAIVGMFAPFLGEVLLMCAIMIPLVIFILLTLVGFAERGY